jgi:iron complex outermembrane receptor protein
VAELYGGQTLSDLTASGDPCDVRSPAQANNNANSGQGLRNAGSTCSRAVANGGPVTNFQSGNNNQTDQQQQVLIGGNPHLSPEKSNNWGVGAVLTPHFAPGLTLAADYYNIRIDNTILTGGIVGATSVDAVLLGCYGGAQNQAYCNLIHRNATGTIVRVDSLNANFGISRVTGIDYELTYDTALARLSLPVPGSLRLDLQLSEQYINTQTNADGSLSSYTGTFQYANEAIEPKFKGIASLDYNVGPWTAHWDTRYIEHLVNFDGSTPVYGNQTSDIWYHDLAASYTFGQTSAFKNLRLILGVDNLFDRDPPFLSADSICKCNSLAGPYDFVGRYFYGRISAKF